MEQLAYSIIGLFFVNNDLFYFSIYADYQKNNYYTLQQIERIHQSGSLVPLPSTYFLFCNMPRQTAVGGTEMQANYGISVYPEDTAKVFERSIQK